MRKLERLPSHVAITMDGNGRWAEKRAFSRFLGHRVGVESVREIVGVSRKLGVKYLTLYVFSMENWKRPQREIKFLFNLLKEALEEEIPRLKRNNIKLLIMGKIEELPRDIKEVLERGVQETSGCNGMNLIIALNYSGRVEIIDAINQIIKSHKVLKSEEDFSRYLYLNNIPEPDLLIRTSGELRISNFMLWQIAYTELFFTEILWPDFRRKEFLMALEEFSKRERRFGGVSIT